MKAIPHLAVGAAGGGFGIGGTARFAGGDADRAEAFDAYAPSLVRKLYLEQRDGMESRR